MGAGARGMGAQGKREGSAHRISSNSSSPSSGTSSWSGAGALCGAASSSLLSSPSVAKI
jgi:hypothetical protein